jgi:elongation factor 1 alpha-like protein
MEGHVDAGKSTLMGQVLFQLGHVAKRTVQKYQKQATEIGKASFALAWVMDEDDAERERGVTMDVATKSISTSNHDFVILDAPVRWKLCV